MIESELFLKHSSIKHGFFTRKGGASEGIYNSLNLGAGSKDLPENIEKNRNIISQKFNVPTKNLVTLHQTHSNRCVYITDNNKHIKYEADAAVTKEKNIVLGVLTADCVPIFLYDTKNEIIGAVHAGWRGAASGILKSTLFQMEDLGGNRNNIIAAIGPCIGAKSYEVSRDFKQGFLTASNEHEVFFKNSPEEGKDFFDIRAFVTEQLYKLSIKQIDNIEHDTFAESDSFFSYRRSCINNEADYGRQISAICMK